MRSFFLNASDLTDDDEIMLFKQGEVVVQAAGGFLWSKSQLRNLLSPELVIILVSRGEQDLIVVELPEESDLPRESQISSLRGLLFNSEDALIKAGKGNQILDWYHSHQFCGYCAAPTAPFENQLAFVCERCNHHFFPRINPCVIVLVTKGKDMLLARSARYKTGFYSCLAGFIEVGESAEDTIHREVKEESGLEVENIRYFKSQSWPFPSQLMLGYYAEYKSGEIVPEPEEIEEADWYSIDNMPNTPSASISVAGDLIDNFVRQMQSATD